MTTSDRPTMRDLLARDYDWTPRQREVLDRITQGKGNQQIADELGISLDGAKWHMREILGKLGVDTREEAAEYWRRYNGIPSRLGRVFRGLGASPLLGLAGAAAGVGALAAVGLLLLSFGRNDSTPVGAESPSPTLAVPTTVAVSAGPPCPTGPGRDPNGWLTVSLGDPACVGAAQNAPVVQLKAELTAGGESVFAYTGPGPLRLSAGAVPRTPAGCTEAEPLELRVAASSGIGGGSLVVAHISCGLNLDTAECPEMPIDPKEGGLALSREGEPECIAWEPAAAGTDALRLELTYPRSGLIYAYLLPPETTVFRVPADRGSGSH